MSLGEPNATWPPGRPEIPAPWPGRPPSRPEPPAPQPILPSWLEPNAIWLEHDLADRLLEKRVIVVGGRLDDALASRVAAQLLLLDGQSTDPITLHLSCADAELEPSLALAGAIDLVASPVHAVVRGTLRGPAIAVLCAAEQRTAHRHTMFILLSPQFSGDGTVSELTTLADQHERQVARLRDLIARATGRPTDEVAADLEPGRVLDADQAKEYGLVTSLL
jgi:ATP-dependent Clp protease protease subunit